jgi:hypothetical protein
VHDAAAGRHPLHVAGLDGAAVALEVLVRHGPLQRKAREKVIRDKLTTLWHRFPVKKDPTFPPNFTLLSRSVDAI